MFSVCLSLFIKIKL